jgi:hypothetical protein
MLAPPGGRRRKGRQQRTNARRSAIFPSCSTVSRMPSDRASPSEYRICGTAQELHIRLVDKMLAPPGGEKDASTGLTRHECPRSAPARSHTAYVVCRQNSHPGLEAGTGGSSSSAPDSKGSETLRAYRVPFLQPTPSTSGLSLRCTRACPPCLLVLNSCPSLGVAATSRSLLPLRDSAANW